MRRGPIEIYRDVLLSVAMSENYTEKPTRIMYKANMSWAPLNKILTSMVEFGMLELIDVHGQASGGRRKARLDQRSTYRYRVSKKGFVILRIMDLLFEYVETPSTVNVPPAIMRIIARTSGYGGRKGDFDKIMNEMINEEMPKLLYEPVPIEEEEGAMEDLSVPQPFVSPKSIDAHIIDAGIDWLTRMEDEEEREPAREAPKEIESKVVLTPVSKIPARTRTVPANSPDDVDDMVFITEKTFDGMFKCPVCGRPAPSENAIIKHVKKYHGKKALIAVD